MKSPMCIYTEISVPYTRYQKYIVLKWFNQSMNNCDQGDIHVNILKWVLNVRELSCNAIANTFDDQNVCCSSSQRHVLITFSNRTGRNAEIAMNTQMIKRGLKQKLEVFRTTFQNSSYAR